MYMKSVKLSIVILLVLIAFIGFNLAYSCTPVMEAFGTAMAWKSGRGLPEMGSNLNWSMEQGLPNAWNKPKGYPAPPLNHNQIQGTPIPLEDGKLFIFGDNKSSPGCCSSTYSSSDGCICTSQAQIDYINQRGGNRTMDDGY